MARTVAKPAIIIPRLFQNYLIKIAQKCLSYGMIYPIRKAWEHCPKARVRFYDKRALLLLSVLESFLYVMIRAFGGK